MGLIALFTLALLIASPPTMAGAPEMPHVRAGAKCQLKEWSTAARTLSDWKLAMSLGEGKDGDVRRQLEAQGRVRELPPETVVYVVDVVGSSAQVRPEGSLELLWVDGFRLTCATLP